MTDTLRTLDGQAVLRIERRLVHPPEKVWRALTEPAQLNAWFPFDVDVELRPGAAITFLDRRPEPGPETHGRITELDPPRTFAFSWGEDHLRWEIRPDGAASLLILTHTFGDRAGAASFASGWTACIVGLDQLLTGRPVAPSVDMTALHEEYIAAFGMAVGSVRTVPGDRADRWVVRFERQLTVPIKRAWDALTDGGSDGNAVGSRPPSAASTAAVACGTVTEVGEQAVLEYSWLVGGTPRGHVRWQLVAGTGQGARLVLEQDGPAELATERDTSLAAWQTHIEEFATECAASRSGSF